MDETAALSSPVHWKDRCFVGVNARVTVLQHAVKCDGRMAFNLQPATTNTKTKTKTKTNITLAAAVALLPGLLAACSGAPSAVSTSEATNGNSRNGSSLASCMRDKGYDMADPKSGAETLSAPEGVDKEQWSTDFNDCFGAPEAGAGDGFKAGGRLPAAAAAEAAACIRDKGFEDFPDSGTEQDQYLASNQSDTALMDASDECFGTLWKEQGVGDAQ